jgi:protein phosphatase
VITRSLGPHPSVHIDLEGPYTAEAGDMFLICSDGLSGPVTDEEIGVVLQCMNPDEAAQTLVDLANFRGGPDNISVVIAQVNGSAPAAASSMEEVAGAALAPRWPTAPLWLSAGAFLAIFGYCVANEYWPGAIGSAIGFVASVAAGFLLRAPAFAACPAIQSIGGPYGNGPYRKAKCTPDPAVVATLAGIAGKLRDEANKNHGNRAPDWSSFEELRSQAAEAAEKGDYAAAIRQYSAAIRTIMKKFREQGRTTTFSSDGE